MSLYPPHQEIAHNLSKAVFALQETLQSLITGIEKGTHNLIVTSTDSVSKAPNPPLPNHHANTTKPPGTPTEATLLPATPETTSQLSSLHRKLQTMEQTLRSRSQWHPPPPSPYPTSLPLLSLPDLESAINLLEQILTHSYSSHDLTPRPSFSTQRWTWDLAWKEFYTHIPDRQMYVYLSRWRLNQARGVWEHESMAHRAGLGPEVAAEELGAWKDWKWDPLWGEWYLDVVGERGEQGERCCVYASRWRVEENGEWVYDGRFGGAEGE